MAAARSRVRFASAILAGSAWVLLAVAFVILRMIVAADFASWMIAIIAVIAGTICFAVGAMLAIAAIVQASRAGRDLDRAVATLVAHLLAGIGVFELGWLLCFAFARGSIPPPG